MAQELVDLDVTHVSLVDKGANQRRFAVTKRNATGEPDAIHKAIQAAVAKGRGEKTGVLAAIKKVVRKRRRVAKSAADLVMQATWALSYVMDLIEDEAADISDDPNDPDAAEDQSDVDTLRAAAALLTDYIAATGQEVGTADDLEDLAEEAAAYAGAMQSYYPIYMRDGGIAKADQAAPSTATSMSDHLTADAPKGHGVADSKTTDSTMADLTKLHDSMHGSGSGAKHSHGDAVAKGLKQFSNSRVTRLKEASDAFASVLAEIETEESDSKDTKKRAQPEEVPVTSDEIAAITKAIGAALEPRFAEIEKRLPAAAAVEDVTKGAGATDDGDWTMAGIGSAISKLIDRVEKVEHQRGERTSATGQDTTGGDVKKRGTFAGVLRDA